MLLFGFEGTHDQSWVKDGRSGWHKDGNPNGRKSFVMRCCQRATGANGTVAVIDESSRRIKLDPGTSSVYFAGPNIDGNNCGAILVDAINQYEHITAKKSQAINLIGYSRGGYIAMCFAKWLKDEKNVAVNFIGLFDAVTKDFKDSVNQELNNWKIYKPNHQTSTVPDNVRRCHHVARDSRIGSRSYTMDHAGAKAGAGVAFTYRTLPGSHASMGGFPNEAGTGDGPWKGQGDPKNPAKFHPLKEKTAWWLAAQYISEPAIRAGVLSEGILSDFAGPQQLMPEKDWYVPHK